MPARKTDAEHYLSAAAKVFGLSVEDLTGTSRPRLTVLARQIAAYAMSDRAGMTTDSIGYALRRDHSTIRFAINAIHNEIHVWRDKVDAVHRLARRRINGCRREREHHDRKMTEIRCRKAAAKARERADADKKAADANRKALAAETGRPTSPYVTFSHEKGGRFPPARRVNHAWLPRSSIAPPSREQLMGRR